MPYIDYKVKNRIGYITLNRPEKRNALNAGVVTELREAFSRGSVDKDVKVMVLRANGKAFCAGADLAYLHKLQSNSFEDNLHDSQHLMELFLQMYRCQKVIIAQIQGHAIAGGAGLAVVCDFSFAMPEVKIGYSEVKIGFVPAVVNVFLLRKIGEGKARELLLTGDLVSAETAQEIGLINRVVSSEKLEEHVDAFAQRLCRENSGTSMKYIKQMIEEVQSFSLSEGLAYASRMNAVARSSDDCKRGIAAYLNKEEIMW